MSRFSSRAEFEQWKAERAARLKQSASSAPPTAADPATGADAEGTENAIGLAWQLGAGIAVLLLIGVIVSAGGFQVLDLTLWSLIDVALILVLSFGVYKKDRASALLLLIYLVITRTFIWALTGKPYALGLVILLSYFFLQGIRGAFAYHASAEDDSDSSPGKPVAAALSIAALFVLLLFGKQAGLSVDLSRVYTGDQHTATAPGGTPSVSKQSGVGEPAPDSQTIISPINAWLEFSPPGGRFSIEMPKIPLATQESVHTSAGQMTLHRFDLYREVLGEKYSVQYADYPEALMHKLKTADTVLNNASTVDVDNIRGRLVSGMTVSLLGRYPGRDLQIENADMAMRIRLFFVDRRLYKITAACPLPAGCSGDVDLLMDSFQVTTQQ